MVEATKLKKQTEDEAVNDDSDPDAPGEGHNSDKMKKVIVQCAITQVDIDGVRKEQNRRASDNREILDDYGIDKEAFREVYNYQKKKRHERDGFDESVRLCQDALGAPEQKDLFDVLKDAA